MTVDYVSTYLSYVNELLNNQIVDNISQIKDLPEFQTFRRNNLITISDAWKVDEQLFGTSGGYWMSAYDYPSEGDDVYMRGNYMGRAVNVGLLTFNIE
jgi:hypothetical protein